MSPIFFIKHKQVCVGEPLISAFSAFSISNKGENVFMYYVFSYTILSVLDKKT